jgi:hypothetical protein
MSSEILEELKPMHTGSMQGNGDSKAAAGVSQASLPSSFGNPQTGWAAREGDAGSNMASYGAAGQHYKHHNGGAHHTVKAEPSPKTEDIDHVFQPQPTAESSKMGAARLAAEGGKDIVKHEHTDTEDFLKFQTEDDKVQVKLDPEEENGSKSASPDLRDDDDEEQEEEEDVKPKVKPGLPRSIADLPVAEAEVNSHRAFRRSACSKLCDCIAGHENFRRADIQYIPAQGYGTCPSSRRVHAVRMPFCPR